MTRSAVAIILRAEVRAWRNRIAGNAARTAGIAVLGGLSALVIGGSLFALAFFAGRLLPASRDAMLSGAFTSLAVLMLVVGFPTVISTFFAGRDLVQLILAPVTAAEIFIARSLFAMSANTLAAAIFLTFVAGLGAGSGASPLYYVTALVLLAVLVLMVTALQLIFMAGVLKLVPARVARDVAIAVASVTGAGLYLLWNLTLRQSFAPRHTPDISGVLMVFQRIEWVPSAWPGHALSAVIDGSVATAVAWTGVTLLLAGAMVVVAAALYERTLLAGLGLLGGPPARWRRRTRVPVRASRAGAASPVLAIVRKDWIAYRRDIRRLSRFLPAVIFLVAYAFILVRPTRGLTDLFWNDVFVVTFVSLFMAMMFATPSIPGERRGIQLLRLAPISPWTLIRAKVLFTVAPAVALTTLITLAMSLVGGIGPLRTAEIVLLAIWLGVGCVCIGVSAGAIDPRFDSTDDRRSVGVVGTFAAMGGELAFGLLSVGSFAVVFVAVQVATGAGFPWLPKSPVIEGLLLLVAVALALGGVALVGFMLWTAVSRLRSFEGSITTAA